MRTSFTRVDRALYAYSSRFLQAQQPMMATATTGGMGQPTVAIVQPSVGGVGTQFAMGGATPFGLAGAGLGSGVNAGMGTGVQGTVGAGGYLGPFAAQSTLGGGVLPRLGHRHHHHILPGGGYYEGGGYPYGGYYGGGGYPYGGY